MERDIGSINMRKKYWKRCLNMGNEVQNLATTQTFNLKDFPRLFWIKPHI